MLLFLLAKNMDKSDKLQIRLEIYDERGAWCENPDCNRPATDLHHGVISDRKRLKDILFTKFNLIMLCNQCNVSRMYDNVDGRQYWFDVQCARYGEFDMLSWLGDVNRLCIIPFVFDRIKQKP